jgi:hypothetical protein
MTMRSMMIVGACLLAACAAHHGSTSAPATAAAVPCPVLVPSADSLEWKLVQASGFTFCVPPGWRLSGARGWHAEGAGIEWRIGSWPQSTTIDPRWFPAGIHGPGHFDRHLVELIGGESAELWDIRIQDSDYTAAQWAQKRVFFKGKANGLQSADLELMIYRTVRFNASDLGT